MTSTILDGPRGPQNGKITQFSMSSEERAAMSKVSALLGHAIREPGQTEGQCKLVGPDGEAVVVPDLLVQVLEQVTEILTRGDAVTVVPVGKELTSQQAANILNVSRQYLVGLLDEQRIPCSKTGKHRRVRVEDVLTFKERRDQERMQTLDELTSMSEEFGGYKELK